jgi:hypothetical protein
MAKATSLLLLLLCLGCAGTSVKIFEERIIDGRRRPHAAAPPLRVASSSPVDDLILLLDPAYEIVDRTGGEALLEARLPANRGGPLHPRVLVLEIPDADDRVRLLLGGSADLGLVPDGSAPAFADGARYRVSPTPLEGGIWLAASSRLARGLVARGATEALILASAVLDQGP